MKRRKIFYSSIILGIFIFPNLFINADQDSMNKKENIKIKVEAIKKSFKPGEPVPIVVAVANFNDKSVYIPVNDPEVFDPYFRIKDVNGVTITGDPIALFNNTIPLQYYMQREGKNIIVFPLLEIKEKDLILTVIPNALKNYSKGLLPGRYYIEASGFPIMLEAKEVITRPDYSNWLWVESRNNKISIKHELIEIVIE